MDESNATGRLNLALAYLSGGREDDARSALATIAQPQRIDGLIDELHQRLQQMQQDKSRGEALLLSSRQRLQLSTPE
nr:hypothetical protein PJ912_17765 [Pectobacterium colocasium]